MSQQLIDRSSDLKKLRDEGYDLEVRPAHLLVKDVPYVNVQKKIKRGVLVCTLTTSGDTTAAPDNNVMYFSGEYP